MINLHKEPSLFETIFLSVQRMKNKSSDVDNDLYFKNREGGEGILVSDFSIKSARKIVSVSVYKYNKEVKGVSWNSGKQD